MLVWRSRRPTTHAHHSQVYSSTSATVEDSRAQQLQRLKDKTKNVNTEKSTTNWARVFAKWQIKERITISPTEICPSELDHH